MSWADFDNSGDIGKINILEEFQKIRNSLIFMHNNNSNNALLL